MPFQAIPIALRKNTGSPLSKLVLIFVTKACALKPTGEAGAPLAYIDTEKLARLCQASVADTKAALDNLAALGEIDLPLPEVDGGPDYAYIEVRLPLSALPSGHRQRIKCSPDQIELLISRDVERGCALCGLPYDEDDAEKWHIDHIIPQSKGGADVEENCQVACSTCNMRKGNKVNWLDFLGRRK